MREKPAILVVDDNAEILLATERVLGRLDARLITARSGTEAADLATAYRFAVVLLDVQMPGIDGFETARRVRSASGNKHAPIIFITANQARGIEFKGYEAGAVDYLVKPVDPQILKCKVKVFLQLDRQRRAIERLSQELAEHIATLQRTQNRLTQSERLAALGALAGGLAQELGEPLEDLEADIRYSIDNLADRARAGEDGVAGALANALACSQRCTEVVRDLLMFAAQPAQEPRSSQGPCAEQVEPATRDSD